MVKRKVVFRKKRQNRLGMFLVLMVVLMLLVVVSLKSAELRQKQETYAARERVLQEQIDAEKARTEEIEEYRKYTQTKKYVEEVAKDKLGLVNEGEIIYKPDEYENKGSAARLRVLQDFFYSCGQRYGGRERVFMRGFAGAKTTGRDRLTEKPTAKSAEKRISWRKKEI